MFLFKTVEKRDSDEYKLNEFSDVSSVSDFVWLRKHYKEISKLNILKP